jgi:hypothetical protein
MVLDQAIVRLTPEVAGDLAYWMGEGKPGDVPDSYWQEGAITPVWMGRGLDHVQTSILDLAGQHMNRFDYVFLSRELVETLRKRCEVVLEHRRMAPAVMPVGTPFFGGDETYADTYFEGVEEFSAALDILLAEWDPDATYAYWAWW